ncbi:PREDICTED: (E,E)-geranyllinalool synthase-like isoform X2 [Camelina sativa]|uniref:(E,E)-geranyllinalool synthase-like isoform X2 n=1 Tax=Camelina sativa TaxID=90675 RepID=A0ABM0SYQ7_CAMSA|nr:PREDICTED: (E,E)-geranyllinalool synthase-like isoform X2 [Camelina sativa]
MKFKSHFTSDLYFIAEEIKRDTFELDNFNTNPYSFVSPSAYDTAWLAMIEDDDTLQPMFQGYVDWILNNQNVIEGLWGRLGDENGDETLTSTLACVVALRKWNIGSLHVHKGKRYIERSMESIIGKYTNPNMKGSCPRWLVLMFTGLLEIAEQLGLRFLFSTRAKRMINNLLFQRKKILQREKLVDDRHNQQSLLAYLEVLPSTLYAKNQKDIIQKLGDSDGSLFQSPSATAAAYMLSRNTQCLAYLKSLVQRCPDGVPQVYPLSEELIKLTMVNIMDNFGLAEYFGEEIDHFILQIYKNYEEENVVTMPISSKVDQLHKASLEFRMLRLNGYDVLPRSFCWFLSDEEIRDHLETNTECLFFVMLSVYRATDLMFPGECELEEAREFSRKFLNKSHFIDEQFVPIFHIKHEISSPWRARLKHLDHRMWIEDKDSNAFSVGKASLIRISIDKFTHLALRNFELRQAVYRHEMEDLITWVKKSGLNDIGFGREKTTYCYFAASSSTSLPIKTATNIRKLMAKSGILITVADDFFDEEGSFDELGALTKAVIRWEGEALKGYGKIIFKALDDLVKETAETCLKGHGTDITDHLRNIHKLKPGNYDDITALLMTITRLLNDLQSYQKEQEQRKINSVLLHMKSHCGLKIEDSIAYIEKIIDSKRKEFMEYVLMDKFSDLSKPCKDIHMSLYKVFEMFFNKKNRYDSDTEMLEDIKKALYDPINLEIISTLRDLSNV